MKKYLFISLFFLFTSISFTALGQDINVTGQVVSERGEPIYLATVHQKDGSRFVYTNEHGRFAIKLPKGKSIISFSCMGYASQDLELELGTDKGDIKIVLQELSLSLDEVIVVARSVENKSGTSVYEIGEQAIKQVQATHLGDILSLLPGKKITPPNLNTAQYANLRTAATSTANNFGTSIIMDGVQINTDGDMQVASPASSTAGGTAVDLRSINAAGIEKIEVISGVASPKYGDLTSGAIVVQSRVGRSPLVVSANLNPSAYQFSLNQGLQLPGKSGFVNTDLSYTYSNASPTDRKDYYHNINAAIRWRTKLNDARDWYNTISFHLNTSTNGQRLDPDEIYENIRTANSQRYILSLSGSLKLLGTLSYSLTGNIENQYSHSKTEATNGPFPMFDGLEEGTFFTTYSPQVYKQEMTIKGLPVNLSGRIETDQEVISGNYRISFNTGLQYSYVKNHGEGRLMTGNVVGVGGAAASRGAKFHEIPASTSLSGYHETNARRITDKSRHEMRLGLRYDYMNSRYNLLSPRISYFVVLKERLKLKAAFGVSYKAPAMIQLYPGPSYHDFTNLSYYATNPNERLAVVTTHIVQPTNDHLKPSKGETIEFGIDWEGEKFTVRTTYYHKQLSRGIYSTPELLILDKQMYEVISRPPNQQPIVAPIEGEITKILRTQGVVKNNYTATTNGFEAVIVPPRIEATNTSINLNLSYMETVENDNGYRMELPSTSIGEESARYGVYVNPIRNTKVSTGSLTIVQHIPSLRLVFNLVAELNFLNYSTRDDGSIYPYAYYDGTGQYHEIPEADRDNPEYANLKLPEHTYLTVFKPPFYTNYHLQVRKETTQGHSFSFYANNSFWYNPVFYKNDVRRTMNSTVVFGFGVSLRITQ